MEECVKSAKGILDSKEKPYKLKLMSKHQIIKNIDGLTIEIKHLELDYPVNWHQANTLCEEFGNGWRLPMKNELELIYTELCQKGNGSFKPNYYWSGTQTSSFRVYALHFGFGVSDFGYSKEQLAYVCAVRTI
jgi:hypothetical protein